MTDLDSKQLYTSYVALKMLRQHLRPRLNQYYERRTPKQMKQLNKPPGKYPFTN